MRKFVPYILTGAMTLAFVIGGSVRSEASLIAYICDDFSCSGGGDIIVQDNAAGDLAAGVNGAIVLTGINYNGWEFYLDASESKPLLGSAAAPQLDITYNFVNNTDGASPFYLFVSDTDFTGLVDVNVQLGGTSSISPFSIVAGAFGGTTNTNAWSFANELCQTAVLTSSPYADTCTGGPVGNLVNPYSLTLGMFVVPGGTGAITGDLQLTSTPEPATILMLGTGLVGAAIRRRRRAA